MTYKYKCDKCKKEVEIVKPMAESGTEEKCDKCDIPMRRKFSDSIGIKTNDGYKS